MQDDVIIYMIYGIVYLVGAGIIAFAGKHTVKQAKQFIPELVPPLRRFFDAGTPGAIVIEQVLHVDPAHADKFAEAIADAVASLDLKPAQEVNIPAPPSSETEGSGGNTVNISGLK